MRMVTPKKREDGELNSSKPIILKKTNNSLVGAKYVIVDNLNSECDIGQTVRLRRESVVVVSSEVKRSDSLRKTVSLRKEPVVVVTSETKYSDSKCGLRQTPTLSREPVLVVSSKTKRNDNESGFGLTVSLHRDPQVVVPSENKLAVVKPSENKSVVVVPLENKPALVLPSEKKSSIVDGKKRVRFTVCKMDTDTNFKVTLSIKKEADGAPVFFKVDGNRFKKEKTIKLMVETPYRVDFSFKPTQTMTQAVFRGQESETTERSHDSTASAYSARLCVQNTPHSQKGHRDDLDLRVQLKGGLTLQSVLQVKYYKAGDSQHCEWGSTFHCLELDCETHADAGLVAILKETFR